jgi:hypothetical protein
LVYLFKDDLRLDGVFFMLDVVFIGFGQWHFYEDEVNSHIVSNHYQATGIFNLLTKKDETYFKQKGTLKKGFNVLRPCDGDRPDSEFSIMMNERGFDEGFSRLLCRGVFNRELSMMLGLDDLDGEFSARLGNDEFDEKISTMLGRDDEFDRGFSEMYRRRVFDSEFLKVLSRGEVGRKFKKSAIFHIDRDQPEPITLVIAEPYIDPNNNTETTIPAKTEHNNIIVAPKNNNGWITEARKIAETIYKDNSTLSNTQIAKKVHDEMTHLNDSGKKGMTGRGGRVPKKGTIERRALAGIKK